MLKSLFSETLKKTLLYISIDIIIVVSSFLGALSLWYDPSLRIPGSKGISIPDDAWSWFLYIAIIAPIICIICYTLFRLYNNLWKYANTDDILKVVIAATFIFVLIFAIDKVYLYPKLGYVSPRRLYVIAWMLNLILFMFSRFGYRMIKRSFIIFGKRISKNAGYSRIMVIGGGYVGRGLVDDMINERHGMLNKLPVIVVDDDPKKNNSSIHGIRVISSINNIIELVEQYKIDEIYVGMPSTSKETMRQVMEQCTQTDCTLKIVPPISDYNDDTPTGLRDVNIADLLCRDEVTLDSKSISDYIKDKVILVTGGGGSIGSEICRQMSRFSPKIVVMFDIYENNVYELYNELKPKYTNVEYNIRIGSIRDISRLEQIFTEFEPNVVFHAAAHKHVTLLEDSPAEAIKNNVFGTLNVVRVSEKHKVERFVLLSTDKAVNPYNVMGATKRIAELIIQSKAKSVHTKFMAVRFGNVLGSNGSIVPLFKQQIEKGGPVTVTHPDVVRFFMTIPEASQLVLQAGALGESGNIFVLEMGSPVKIYDLAVNLIKLSGLTPGRDIKIVFTGLRPGDKLYEELVLFEERDEILTTKHKKFFITKPVAIDEQQFLKQLKHLKILAKTEPQKAEEYLHVIVPNFVSGSSS